MKVNNFKHQVLSKMKTIQKIISAVARSCLLASCLAVTHALKVSDSNAIQCSSIVDCDAFIHRHQQQHTKTKSDIFTQFTIQTIRTKVISLHCRNKQQIQLLFKSWLSDDVRSFRYTIVSSIFLARRSLTLLNGKCETKSKQLFGVWYARTLEKLTEISNEPKSNTFPFTIQIDAKCECLRDFNYYILTLFSL